MPRLILPASAIILALAAGCSSDSGPSRHERAEMRRQLPPPLEGQTTYFGGQIVVELRLGSGLLPMGNLAAADRGSRPSPGQGRPHHGGMSGGEGMNGGGMRGGPMGGSPGAGGPGGGSQRGAIDPAAEGDGAPRGGGVRGSSAPPVMVHIDLTNRGATTATVSVTDFSSPLGNFVVFPDHLDLAPGQTVAFEPMTSRLGDDFSEVSVALTMKLGSRSEKQMVTLHQVPTPPPASTAPVAN